MIEIITADITNLEVDAIAAAWMERSTGQSPPGTKNFTGAIP